MRTPTRHWTRHALGTGRCGLPRATSSCAANALNASLTQPSRVSPMAPEALPLGFLLCQGPHFSSLPSRAHGFQVPPRLLLPQEPHRAGRAGAQTRQGEPSTLTVPSGHLPPTPLGSYQVLASMYWGQVVWETPVDFQGRFILDQDPSLLIMNMPSINGSCYC